MIQSKIKKMIALSVLVTSVSLTAFGSDDSQQQGECRGKGPHGPRLELTDEQRTCLEGILGKPGEGERPSHEQMDAALSSCGIEKPARPSEKQSEVVQ